MGERLTYDNVLEVLGAVDTSVFSRLLRFIDSGQFVEAVRLLEEVVIQGRSFPSLLRILYGTCVTCFLVQGSGNLEDVLDISSENLAALKEEAEMIDNEKVMRYIRVFSELSSQVRYSSQKRVLIEVALVKLCQPSMEEKNTSLENQVGGLAERLSIMERQLASGAFVPAGGNTSGNTGASGLGNGFCGTGAGNPAAAGKLSPDVQGLFRAMPEDLKAVIGEWGRIISDVPLSMGVLLKSAQVAAGRG